MKTLRSIYYSLPISLRYVARRLYYLPQDLLHDQEMIPPKGMIYTGGGDFVETGQRFVQFFKELGGLKESDSVLDIGSGIGRIAIPLTQYLDKKGSYQGVDLVPKGINWCNKNISPKYPNFKFQLLDLDNDLYIKSDQKASEYRFPYQDQQYDFIYLISVFTHMDIDEIQNYLKEISRMLKTDGSCFFTCFHYKNKTKLTENEQFSFRDINDSYSYMDPQVKMANVAIHWDLLSNMIKKADLKMVSRYDGNWHKPSIDTKDFQDIVIVKRS